MYYGPTPSDDDLARSRQLQLQALTVLASTVVLAGFVIQTLPAVIASGSGLAVAIGFAAYVTLLASLFFGAGSLLSERRADATPDELGRHLLRTRGRFRLQVFFAVVAIAAFMASGSTAAFQTAKDSGGHPATPTVTSPRSGP